MRIPALPSLASAKRCLLVLDLNGTLLHRRRTNSGANTHIYVRPYLGAFLCYISHPAATLDVAVWSSARRANVELMVERAWTGASAGKPGSGSAEGLGGIHLPNLVFAREDMLLTDRQFRRAFRHGTFHPDHNVRTTKDLRQLWLRLAQLRDEQVRTWVRQEQSRQIQYPSAGSSNSVVRSPETLDHPLHGPHDTILLDDSAHKARLQPNNHLSIPTYGAAELHADADVLTAPIPATIDPIAAPQVDEALIAVVGILSEIRNGPVDEWNRTGRIWRGPGARLDPHEMWAQRQRVVPPPDSVPSTSTRSASPNRGLAGRLQSRPGRFESTLTLSSHEPDPPFVSTRRPTVPGETPQWFSSPPLVRAWVEHGRHVLTGLGIQVEHECVQAWPGWREGKREIQGRSKDDVAVARPAHRVKKDTDKSRRQETVSWRGSSKGGGKETK